MTARTGPQSEPAARIATSILLARFRAQPAATRITLAEIAAATAGRAHGILLVLLALPETIPMLGFSLVLAIPILVIGGCMLLFGRARPLPKWLLRRGLSRHIVDRAIDAALPHLQRMERVLGPRWPNLAGADRLLGGCTALMALLLAIPMPGVNILAALAVASIGIGLLERNGVVVAIALGFAALALLAAVLIFIGGTALVLELLPGVEPPAT